MENTVMQEVRGVHPIAIFREGFSLWKKNWLFMAKVYLLVNIPLVLLNLFIVPDSETKVSILSMFFGVLSWVLGSLVFSSLILSVKEVGSTKENNILRIFKGCLSKYFVRYLTTTALYNIIVIAALGLGVLGAMFTLVVTLRSLWLLWGLLLALVIAVVFFVVAVYFGVRLSLCGYSSILDEAGVLASLKISHNLVKERANPVIGEYALIMLVGILSMIPIGLLGLLPQMLVWAKPAVAVYTLLSSSLLTGISACVIFIMYGKLKENK